VTECVRCGKCCDPVILLFDPQERAAERLGSDEELEPWAQHQYEFFRDHWRSESTFEDDLDGERVTVHRVRCDQYEAATRTCMAQEAKPDVCSGFPWYGRDPRSAANEPIAASLAPQCSFNADVRRMLPIVEVR
jgi:Fe-S-cluster containining protein